LKSKGFTLLEVVVAMSIMVGAVLVLSSSWSGSFTRIRKAQLYNNVAELLERKITEIEILNKDKSLTEISAQEGDFGPDYPQYRWTFAVQEFVMPDMTAMMTSGQSASQDMISIMNQLTQTISQAVLEGTVTVYLNTGEKEIPFSVTTYFVDFNKEIQLPGVGG
jgi:general secretion pathway protein I